MMVVVSAHTGAMLRQLAALVGKEVTAEMVEPWTWEIAAVGGRASAVDFANTKVLINQATRAVARMLTEYDVILTPTLGTPPPELGYFDTVKLSYDELLARQREFLQFTWLYNMTGRPAMSVPLHWDGDGMPIGVQFAGRYADEATLFRLAGQLEQTRPWRKRIPAIANVG
jgi:Asp-tRNA(Asn)/Glu-tRNA(Gln) amidotransferase A subunit family amidase